MLIFLIICLIVIGYSKYVKKNPVVRIGKYGFLIVLTNSMEPTINENELIIIEKNEKYELGDIVTYIDSDNILITHRIMQLDEYSFIAKGDNNSISDTNTDINSIQGKVIYHSKVLGIFGLFYLEFIILIYLVVIIIVYFKAKMREEEKSEIKEK